MNNAEEVDQDDNQILSSRDISYTSRPISLKKRLKNVITKTSRAIFILWSEKAGCEALIREEVLRTIVMHTN